MCDRSDGRVRGEGGSAPKIGLIPCLFAMVIDRMTPDEIRQEAALTMVFADDIVERSSSVVACRTRNRESPGSNPPLLPFRRLGIFRSLHRRPCSLGCINEYLAIDSGGNVSDLVLARNCCLARMLPGEAENGVGMNRSVREGKKCEAL